MARQQLGNVFIDHHNLLEFIALGRISLFMASFSIGRGSSKSHFFLHLIKSTAYKCAESQSGQGENP